MKKTGRLALTLLICSSCFSAPLLAADIKGNSNSSSTPADPSKPHLYLGAGLGEYEPRHPAGVSMSRMQAYDLTIGYALNENIAVEYNYLAPTTDKSAYHVYDSTGDVADYSAHAHELAAVYRTSGDYYAKAKLGKIRSTVSVSPPSYSYIGPAPAGVLTTSYSGSYNDTVFGVGVGMKGNGGYLEVEYDFIDNLNSDRVATLTLGLNF